MLNIAIVIPTYNRLELLKKLIDSIERQIIPNDVRIFCVISNSCSTDGTTQYLMDKEKNQSPMGLIEFIIQNPDSIATYVEAKKNLFFNTFDGEVVVLPKKEKVTIEGVESIKETKDVLNANGEIDGQKQG
jgi:glycosyltransferase involved in cell wall biosynthesis